MEWLSVIWSDRRQTGGRTSDVINNLLIILILIFSYIYIYIYNFKTIYVSFHILYLDN
jgi:hypothetical protein